MAQNGPTAVRVELLRLKVLQLVNEGYNCAEAGAKLGITRVRAWQLVNEEMALIATEQSKEAMDWRMKLTVRKEARMRRLVEIADTARTGKDISGEISALAKADAIDTDLAKLWGANAPVKTDVTSNGETVAANNVFAVPVQEASIEAWLAKQSTAQ